MGPNPIQHVRLEPVLETVLCPQSIVNHRDVGSIEHLYSAPPTLCVAVGAFVPGSGAVVVIPVFYSSRCIPILATDWGEDTVYVPHDLVKLLQLSCGVAVLIHTAKVKPDVALPSSRRHYLFCSLDSFNAELKFISVSVVRMRSAIPTIGARPASKPAMADEHHQRLAAIDCCDVDTQIFFFGKAGK